MNILFPMKNQKKNVDERRVDKLQDFAKWRIVLLGVAEPFNL